MPSKYKRKPGSRSYADYSLEKLQLCLDAIRDGSMTQRRAAEYFKIPRSTIKNKLKNKFPSKPGHPTIFCETEESAFAAHIIQLSEFGFPVDELDFRFVVKAYLSSQGRTVKNFQNNMPGRDWTKLYLKRHPELSVRFAANIKKVRAGVNEKMITEYIENLKIVTEGVPPDRIYNYDESNLTDDPGRKRIICRRGCKYPERVMNSTKSSTSVMFCGSAAGIALPPYIIYKAEHLWSTWTENGPRGARYNRTKHGWMDGATFEEWFAVHFLPVLTQQPGKKVVIDDNLSSHISPNVLRLCQENNVAFVCLPPNSTHLTQPLDIAYFRPLKMKWKLALTAWKESEQGRKTQCLAKDQFPALLKKTMDELEPTIAQNLKSGFRKAGIYPINKHEILNRLPIQDRTNVNVSLIGEVFLDRLKEKRMELSTPKNNRRKKLAVPPGQSINPDAIESSCEQVPKPSRKRGRPKQTADSSDSSSSNEDDNFSIASSGNSLESFGSLEDRMINMESLENFEDQIQEPLLSTSAMVEEVNLVKQKSNSALEQLKSGNFVIVVYEDVEYPGKVVTIDEDGATVDCMKKGNKSWRWPKQKDILFYKWCDIKKKIRQPKEVSKGFFTVAELDSKQF